MNNDNENAFRAVHGGRLLDNIARLIAENFQAENGALSPEEQTAFVWGFRHGVNHLRDLLKSAETQEPDVLKTVWQIADTAVAAWGLETAVAIVQRPPPADKNH
jgi:hypothetical protein